MIPPYRLVLSCEHAGNDVPRPYARYFASPEAQAALVSHRGWDPGSLEIGEAMSAMLGAPLVIQRVTRLLVECNRSLDHPRLFSEFSGALPEEARRVVVERYWRSHRERVLARIVESDEPVVHVGVHTFTPEWQGRARETDIGLLYDPGRAPEGELVRRWRRRLATARPPKIDRPSTETSLRIHLNRPYRGWTDGLTTALRRELPESRYLGIELEVSQRWSTTVPDELGRWLSEGLGDLLSMR